MVRFVAIEAEDIRPEDFGFESELNIASEQDRIPERKQVSWNAIVFGGDVKSRQKLRFEVSEDGRSFRIELFQPVSKIGCPFPKAVSKYLIGSLGKSRIDHVVSKLCECKRQK